MYEFMGDLTPQKWIQEVLPKFIMALRHHGGDLKCCMCGNDKGWAIPITIPSETDDLNSVRIACGRCGHESRFLIEYVQKNIELLEKVGDHEG